MYQQEPLQYPNLTTNSWAIFGFHRNSTDSLAGLLREHRQQKPTVTLNPYSGSL